jgi:hypothetical protein
MTVFWDVKPCSLVEVYRRFRGAYCLYHEGDRPDDGGSKHLYLSCFVRRATFEKIDKFDFSFKYTGPIKVKNNLPYMF